MTMKEVPCVVPKEVRMRKQWDKVFATIAVFNTAAICARLEFAIPAAIAFFGVAYEHSKIRQLNSLKK